MNSSSALESLLIMLRYSNILFTSFSVVTPALITSSGSSSSTVVTRFCTFTAAWSGSVPTLKKTVISVIPLLLDTEDMYVMPGTPLIALSNGVVTALVHTSAFAPVYFAVTTTEGGTISGN